MPVRLQNHSCTAYLTEAFQFLRLFQSQLEDLTTDFPLDFMGTGVQILSSLEDTLHEFT